MNCIGIIMDGNRRWAKEKNLPQFAGHEAGYQKLLEVLGWAREAGARNLIVYAFSTENWNRPDEEVSYLMKLIEMVIEERVQKIAEEKVRVRFIGELDKFPERVRKSMRVLEEKTAIFKEYTLGIAVSYGGKAEIISAVKRLPQNIMQNLTEEEFSKYLWTGDFPDPELIIRTGGQKRLSNFLLWRAAYSELYFTDTYWPALSKEEFLSAIKFFAGTQRNFGK
ncbi:di-trans,poly-cis-decaprenylcistransferase [Candidatus Giovannonibacteria bacterium RIFCSPLOWO2_01_FULL_43_160]|uniref:Isoprenyl transferase n=2 Tax=Candidatus Giovannoniibacteriota TaxID=1752738 RepID=A0A0G1LVP2_9BACT|nr:MAG: Isoprenyl transferase [Candidatus Giovannonibacteria bacterium GW2011_GWB1_43_13]KKS99709.1 MAG: Isoprenyl transferase [Candidatus Giovannonibacteria bacterium GW2011_GWA1_43_15]KKT21881.1 MAG: Isoprenyl transferase [Candidatus Giovannonibacteria bacterium GW2011_GWC2_43_8]KKT63794.1 MAG: Isoprenyl transferase [Candidatus Giovannonibacteria bacterium GW2011_GWA2_44_26]OGF58231.1 MAG: di-trans,poly-cis-decaprenylcistransferase [Candidatus Giovannonibacteria bacterium RIFCSPHIGHO2_01_FULL